MATLVATPPSPPAAATAPTSPVASPVALPTDAAPTTTPDTTPECAVCCEAFSTDVRLCHRRVSCPACDYAVCYKCVRTYLKDLETAPQCMNCQHPWDEEFQHTVLPQAFCQILREKAIVRMVDREKALLPQTQIHVERKAVQEERLAAAKISSAEHKALLAERRALSKRIRDAELRHRAALASAHDIGRMLAEDRRDPLRIQERPIPPVQTVATYTANREAARVAAQQQLNVYRATETIQQLEAQTVLYATEMQAAQQQAAAAEAQNMAPPIQARFTARITRLAATQAGIANALANARATVAQAANVAPAAPAANDASTGPAEPPPEPHAGRGCEQDGCRGFLNRQGKCGVCNTWVCAKCHKVKAGHHDPDHECNEDDVKTVTLLTRETKPCPGCGIHTQRISGCSHMWCTQCHTHFSWTTGLPMGGGGAHNPHMYEWNQQQILQGNGFGGAPHLANVELPCNGPLGYDHQRHVLATLHQRIGLDVTPPGEPCTVMSKLGESMRFCGHLTYVIQRLHRTTRECELRKFDLRIQYLKNDLTLEKWRSQLKRVDKTEKRATSQRLALSVYATASSDLFRTAYQCTTLDELITRALQPLDKLTDYVNQQLDVVDKRHQFKGMQVRITARITTAGRWAMGY
jgi:hypothetical protein